MRLLYNTKNKNRFSLGIIFAIIYIFFSYIAHEPILNEKFSQISLYLFLVWAIFRSLQKRTLLLSTYSRWYFIFAVLCVFSVLYAPNKIYAYKVLYSLLVVLILTYAFSLVIQRLNDFNKLFWVYSFSASILFMILFILGNLHEDERLGVSLFGNSNIFASVFMISAICTIWIVVNNKGFKSVLALGMFCAQIYVLALSGGRKFFLIPFIFLYIILLLKKDASGKKHYIKSTLLFGLIVILLYWAIFNIPIIYNTIGHRLESLVNLITGSGYVDNSALQRNQLIMYGLRFWSERPILGIGINNFMGEYGSITGIYHYAHNNYVELLVDLGIVGFVTYYSFYILMLRKLIKMKDDKSGLRNFFIAFLICTIIFEIGAVTYNLFNVQIMLSFAAMYIGIQKKSNYKCKE